MDTDVAELIAAGRAVAAESMVVGSAGNVSARTGGRMVISRRGADLARLTEDDFAEVAIEDGRVVTGTRPSSETPMHLAVYRSTPARAVVHTHARMAVVLSLLVDEVPPVHYAIHRLGGSIRVAPYATFGSAQLANHVMTALTDRTAALLANHGCVAYGPTVAEALLRAQTTEWLAEIYYRALLAEAPARRMRVLSAADLADVVSALRRNVPDHG